jgi:signal transduction histidine kinase
MRRSLRLKALTIRSVVAALIAAVLGGLLQLSPQPITDLMLRRDLAPEAQHQVLLVEMDAHASPGAWIRIATQLREGGVTAIALVGDRIPALPDPEIVQLLSPGSALTESGLIADWDHRYRTWLPEVGGGLSLPSRILEAAGLEVPEGAQRIPIGPVGVPTLAHDQVAGLNAAALQGRIAVVGALDPWASPGVDMPGSRVALPEAVARLVAGPSLPLLSPFTAGAIAGLLALVTTTTLLMLRASSMRTGFLAGCSLAALLASVVSIRVGTLLPSEILLAAFVASGLTWRATTWQNAELQLQRLQDNLLSRLGEGLGVAATKPEAAWKDLARAAVSWGGADAAWVFERRGATLLPRARAGQVDGVDPEALGEQLGAHVHANLTEPLDLPPLNEARAEGTEPRPLLAVPMRSGGRTRGLLLARQIPREDPKPRPAATGELIDLRAATRRNLQIFANYAALRLRRGRSRAQVEPVVAEQGVRARLHELTASLEQLLDQRDLLLASHQDSRTAHALYDPMGQPLLVDEGFRLVLERLAVPLESKLPAVWKALGLAERTMLQALSAREPTRAPLEIPGIGVDCWIYACTYQNRILGVGIELTDISELQAQDTVKSGLLEMISYRVHNILAAIRGYADLLALGAVEASEVAPRIAARCGEMAEIFDRYEDVARSSEGGGSEPIQVIDLLQEVVAGARRTLGEHRVRLVNTPVALAPALAQRHELARALMALIHETARDTTAEQAVLVELQAPAGAVEILVRSQGLAPPLHMLQRLASEEREQGSALASRLVSSMGGSFVVEGGGEQGARYRIQLAEA